MSERDDMTVGDGSVKSGFTAWLDNFWYHYKWHTIAIAFVIAVVVKEIQLKLVAVVNTLQNNDTVVGRVGNVNVSVFVYLNIGGGTEIDKISRRIGDIKEANGTDRRVRRGRIERKSVRGVGVGLVGLLRRGCEGTKHHRHHQEQKQECNDFILFHCASLLNPSYRKSPWFQ